MFKSLLEPVVEELKQMRASKAADASPPPPIVPPAKTGRNTSAGSERRPWKDHSLANAARRNRARACEAKSRYSGPINIICNQATVDLEGTCKDGGGAGVTGSDAVGMFDREGQGAPERYV
jgi:hypothetical protein